MTARRRRARRREFVLLAVATVTALAAAWSWSVAADGTAGAVDVAAVGAVMACYAALHAALTWRAPGADPYLVPVVALLGGLGLVLVRRLAPGFAAAELRWQLLAVAAVAVTALGPWDTRLLQRYRYSIALAGIALVGVTLLFGRAAADAAPGSPRLWLGVGRWAFQPSEVMKLVLIVFLAGYIDERRELLREAGPRLNRWRLPPVPYLAPLGIMLGLTLGLFVAQRDLGAALLLFAITVGMLYLATLRGDVVGGAVAAFGVGAALLHRHVGIVATRVAIWRDPWSDSQGAGFQLVQGLLAMAGGGVIGAGIGGGFPTSIPAVHTDYIFAAAVEEIGVAGATAILALYGVMAWRGFAIALGARRSFDAHLAAGLTLGFVFQEAIIVGGNLRLMPLTGITLPFLSYGGSSLLVCAVSIGLLLRISRPSPEAPGR